MHTRTLNVQSRTRSRRQPLAQLCDALGTLSLGGELCREFMYTSRVYLPFFSPPCLYSNHCRPAVRTAIRAEDVDYEAQFNKLQKEAEERLDEKVEELMKNIETVGQN